MTGVFCRFCNGIFVVQKRQGKNQGFSLVEIIMSLAILGIIVVALAPLFVFSVQSIQYNRAQVATVNVMNQVMEEIRALDFNEIGTVGGNPEGLIPATETRSVDGRDFEVNTFVSWVDEGGCGSGADADWDYKEVSVVVQGDGFFHNGNVPMRKELSTLFTRNSEQPAITGAHLRVCVFRGWDYSEENRVPVQHVTVKANETMSFTTDRGAGLFLNLPEGDYNVEVDPGFNRMIILPGSYPKTETVTDGGTTQLMAFVELPVGVSVQLQNAETGAPVSVSLPSDDPGSLRLYQPISFGGTLQHDFTQSDSSGIIQSVPAAWQQLWPVGSGYSGAYGLSLSMPGHLLAAEGIIDPSTSNVWNGQFAGPDTSKQLIAKVYVIPPLPPDINPESDNGAFKWTNGGAGTIVTNNPDNYGYATTSEEGVHTLVPYQFFTLHSSDHLSLTGNHHVNFYATSFHFNNQRFDIGNQATVQLHANRLVFNGAIDISGGNNNGELVLSTLPAGSLNHASLGNITVPQEAQDYLYNQMGQVYFAHDVIQPGSGNGEDVVLVEQGAYYFPNGFTLPDDAGKPAGEGGLVKR